MIRLSRVARNLQWGRLFRELFVSAAVSAAALPPALEKFGFLFHKNNLVLGIGVARIFDWGGPKPSKIRLSSPKLRVDFGPKSDIRTIFPPEIS